MASPFAIVVPGDDGAYSMDVPDEGPWTVEARAQQRAGPVRVVRAPAVADFTLTAMHETTVTVLEWPEGDAIAKANVYAVSDEFGVAPRVHAITDSAGTARISLADDEEVLVVAPGFAPQRQNADREHMIIRLEAGYSIAGVIRNPDGTSAAGALLRLDRVNEEGLGAADTSVRRWITNDAGHFAIDGMLPIAGDGVPFVVSAAGHPTTTVTLLPGDVNAIVLLPSELPEVHPTLASAARRASYLTVRLRDANGAVIENAEARVDGAMAQCEGTSPGARTFQVSRPPGAQVGVAFFAPRSGVDGPRKLMEGAAETSETSDADVVEFRLPEVREMTVEIRAPGNIDLLTRHVCIELNDGWSSQRRMGVGADALAVKFSVDPARQVVTKVSADGLATVRRSLTESEIAAGRAVLAVTEGATVRGRLLGASSAVADFIEVRIASTASGSLPISFIAQVPTDDGGFEFERIAPGQWHLDAFWPAGCVARSLDVSVPDSVTAVDLGDFSLPSVVRVRGFVQSDGGEPVGGAVAEFQARPSGAWEVSTPVRADGTFDLLLPITARGTVLVRKHGLGAAVADLDVATRSPVSLRLQREGRLDVRLLVPARFRRSSYRWSVRTLDGAASWQPEGSPLVDWPGFDARFLWRGLGPGPIVVQVAGPGWRLERSVVVVAGATTTVVLKE